MSIRQHVLVLVAFDINALCLKTLLIKLLSLIDFLLPDGCANHSMYALCFVLLTIKNKLLLYCLIAKLRLVFDVTTHVRFYWTHLISQSCARQS